VALINPDKRSQHNIKRVVALPGERVEVRQGELILNGRRLGYTSAPAQRAGAFPGAVSWEHGVGRDHLIALPTTQEAAATDLPETTVPKGHCLVLNDNRGNTYDSRQYGPVPLADIIGRAEYVYWPRWARLSP
jgi:signal peptidase I